MTEPKPAIAVDQQKLNRKALPNQKDRISLMMSMNPQSTQDACAACVSAEDDVRRHTESQTLPEMPHASSNPQL